MASEEEFWSMNCQKQLDFQILYFQEYELQIEQQDLVFCTKIQQSQVASSKISRKLIMVKYAKDATYDQWTTKVSVTCTSQ